MSPEQLLKPRYKVIADYPGNVMKIGHVFNEIAEDEFWTKYPQIFRKLFWYEEIPIEELPVYIRFGEWDKAHTIYKVIQWNPTDEIKNYEPWGWAEGYNEYMISLRFPNNYPATLEEYNNYINSKK